MAVYSFVIPGMVAVFLAAMTRNHNFIAARWIPQGMTWTGRHRCFSCEEA